MARHRGVALKILLIGALLLAFSVPADAQSGTGVGVSPATLEMDDPPLLRGGGKVATLQFQQHDHDLAHVLLSVQSPNPGDHGDASSWITLDPPQGEIEVPRTDDFPVQIEVAVPETAANGLYAARVNFRLTQACEADGGACVGVQAATTATVWIDVQDVGEVKRILVDNPRVRSMEIGSAFQFEVPLENTGNVDANPHIRLRVYSQHDYDKDDAEPLTERWLRDTILRPGERGDYTFIVRDLDLGLGQYWAKIDVYLDDERIHEGTFRTFDIVPVGTLAQIAELRTIRIDGDITNARVGDLIRLEAIVENTGEVPVTASFRGNVLVDGRIVDTFETSPLEIPIGATQGIELVYRVEHAGSHVFEGRIHYGNKITDQRTLLLAVDSTGLNVPGWAWFGLAALAPLALVGMFLLGRRGAAKNQRPPASARSKRGRAPPAASKKRRPAAGHPRAPSTAGKPPRRPPPGRGAAPPPSREAPPKRRP
jgi:hypothetical protein